jgi:uncharacterized RDD family membrane protein YckC/type II secretory pathway pseudopilin PulG
MGETQPLPAPGEPVSVGAPVPAETAPDFVPAGFWIRAGAYMIDGVLVTIVQGIILSLLTVAGLPLDAARMLCALLGVGYFVWMPVTYQGRTLGKMAAGIAVVRMDGSPLTYARCLGRWAGYLASLLLVGMGFAAAGFTKQKRALHDYLADTRVIYIKEISGLRKACVILLAFVPAIIGGLAAVAVPRFNEMTAMAREGSVKAALGSVRAAGANYFASNSANYPAQLTDLVPKNLTQMPSLQLRDHPETSEVVSYDASVCSGAGVDPAKLKDTGKWGYVADSSATCHGAIFIDCTHTDSKQKQWASY